MRDLMIGQRRTGHPRPWRAAVMVLGLLAAAGVVTWFIFQRSVTYEPPDGGSGGVVRWSATPSTPQDVAPGPKLATPTAQPDPGGLLTYRDSNLRWAGGIAVMHLTGSDEARGVAHGKLLPERVEAAASAAWPALEDVVRGSGLWFRLTHDLRLSWRLRFLDDGLSDLDRVAVAGIMRGAGLETDWYQELVRSQTVWDLGSAPATSDTAGVSRALALLGQQAGAPPGQVWLGHAFAAPGLDDGGESLAPVVTFSHPREGIPWAAVGWASGAGVATGINAQGIAILVNPGRARDVRATRSARPILLLARSVLERSSTLEEAVTTLENTATLGAASYLVVDGRSHKWAVVERSPTRAVIARPSPPLALGDFLSASAFAADPENDRSHRASPSAARVARALDLLKEPLTSVGQLASVLRDRRTSDGRSQPLGHRGVPFDTAAQLVIIDPTRMALWVSDPSADGLMRAFDLRHELERVGSQPAPLADIAAEPALPPAAVAQVRAARRVLRAARRLFAGHQISQARELADRALARSPTLPEALLLAGDLAAAANDHASARGFWQHWLDNGPDHPEREQYVRAQLANPRGW